MKHLGIYLIVAFIFNQILYRWLSDPLIDLFQSIYLSLPITLQKILYSPTSLEHLDPTALELSVLFGVRIVEGIGKLVELSLIVVLVWLVIKGISKMRGDGNSKSEHHA